MILKNTDNVMLTFDLAHEIVCRDSGQCTCRVIERQAGEYPPGKGVKTQGTRQMVVTRVKIPKGVHVSPGEQVDVHPSVMKLPTMQARRERGKIAITDDAPVPEQEHEPTVDNRPRRRGAKRA